MPAIQAQAIGAEHLVVVKVLHWQVSAGSDRNRAALQAQLLQQGFSQANQLAAQAQAQQRGLASLQPSLVAANVQQLGAAGTGGLAFNQALLDAAQQRAQLAYQEPISRLNVLGSGLHHKLVFYFNTNVQPGGGGSPGPYHKLFKQAYKLMVQNNIWR